jgi:hypothetical protein
MTDERMLIIYSKLMNGFSWINKQNDDIFIKIFTTLKKRVYSIRWHYLNLDFILAKRLDKVAYDSNAEFWNSAHRLSVWMISNLINKKSKQIFACIRIDNIARNEHFTMNPIK